MSYMHIDNLYKAKDILAFKSCYAMEKIHGSSAHVSWKDGVLTFFAGGCDHKSFIALFDEEALRMRLLALGQPEVVVFGEVYGGKIQGMSKTYGPNMKFIAFEVKIGSAWLNVTAAEQIVESLGLEFVHYVNIPTTLDEIDAQRDAESIQAVRNGMGHGHKREGVVLRPPFEVTKNNGERVIAKHKSDEFKETSSKREVTVDGDRLKVISDAEEIANEWVTPMRLVHVCEGLEITRENTGEIIKLMIADIAREAKDEIQESPEVNKAIGKKTATLVKAFVQLSDESTE